ncbi:hypothetical protein R5M92_13765 [Halomonas sp. Bachu 37]|uniref:hypothetical protein n=1 Tax=Halomonas kashgarensis TaxID=3084920 RepID=UPI0032167ECE
MPRMLKVFGSILFIALMGSGLAACDNEGPAEEAGENIDESMESVGDSMEEIGDDIEDSADN